MITENNKDTEINISDIWIELSNRYSLLNKIPLLYHNRSTINIFFV